jgi:hypothetical protein
MTGKKLKKEPRAYSLVGHRGSDVRVDSARSRISPGPPVRFDRGIVSVSRLWLLVTSPRVVRVADSPGNPSAIQSRGPHGVRLIAALFRYRGCGCVVSPREACVTEWLSCSQSPGVRIFLASRRRLLAPSPARVKRPRLGPKTLACCREELLVNRARGPHGVRFDRGIVSVSRLWLTVVHPVWPARPIHCRPLFDDAFMRLQPPCQLFGNRTTD